MVVKYHKSPVLPTATLIAQVSDMSQPLLKPRPPLAKWLFDRDMTLRQGAVYFETSYETLRRAILPYGHDDFRPPHTALMRRIIAKTAGEIIPNQWYEQVAA